MTISRHNGELQCECDSCGSSLTAAEIDLEEADFDEFWKKLREDGWQNSKTGGGWVHRCPDCV